MTVTTGKPKKVLSQWSTKVSVEFVPLPLEKEQAYWAAMKYFASVLMQDLTAPQAEEAVSG